MSVTSFLSGSQVFLLRDHPVGNLVQGQLALYTLFVVVVVVYGRNNYPSK